MEKQQKQPMLTRKSLKSHFFTTIYENPKIKRKPGKSSERSTIEKSFFSLDKGHELLCMRSFRFYESGAKGGYLVEFPLLLRMKLQSPQ